MSFNKKFFTTGGIVASSAECNTDTADIFGDGNGVALYNLDYDASDASGNYDGTPNDVTFGVGGAIGNYGARFNGTSSYIDSNYTLPADSTMSFSMWLKQDTHSSGLNGIFSDFDSSGSNQNSRFTLAVTTSNALYINIGNGSSYWTNSSISMSSYIDTWMHLCVTINGTSVKVYINGGTPTNLTSTVSFGTAGATDHIIGRLGLLTGSGRYYKGDLDQIRIFTSVLTSDQVEDLHEEEACVHTATTTNNGYPTTNVAYYKLDNSADDSVGTNDGTETDIEYRFGRYAQAAVFNGSSSYIETPSIIPTNDYSLSCWVNFDSLAGSGSYQLIYEAYKNTFWYLALYDGGKIATFNGTSTFNTTSDVISTGQWYHIVYTSSSTNGKNIYLNGNSTPVATTSDTTGNSNISGSWEGFGKYHNNTLYLDGKIDQVRIYSTALDSDQVSQLYNEKPETDTSNFKTVLYTGDNGSQYISNVGMDLETNGGLVWIKSRDVASSHTLHDSVRGYDTDGTGGANSYKPLHSNTTSAETVFTSTWHNNFGFLNSLEANGFTVVYGTGSTSDNYNKNDEDYVAWLWKGGGDASNIAVNSITSSTPSIASDVSANTEAGFSIVRHTGTSTAGTIAHGLDQAPEFIMTKSSSHDTGDGFTVYADGLAQSDSYLNMASASIPNPNSVVWTTSAHTTDIFNVGTATGTNSSGKTYISYCWHSVSGYSKIGTYSGSGISGKEVALDFNPSFVLIKRTNATTGWVIVDDKRGTKELYAHLSNIEDTTTTNIVLGTNKFTLNSTGSWYNALNGTYLYMAFK